MPPTDLKVAYIGGGSRDWARKLMFDLALCPDLTGEVALYDIDMEAAHLNAQLGNWLQEQPGVVSSWHYAAVATLPEALIDADFVIISIQPGPLELMADEIALAEQYGLYFPVGDTTGAPGLMRGLRSTVIFENFAKAIANLCPQAWIINYTNPMSVCTRALTHVVPRLKVFGCCHEVFSTQGLLARIASQYLKIDIPPRSEIDVNVLGINHFTWIDQATYQGYDLFQLLNHHLEQPGSLRTYSQEEVVSWNDWFYSTDQVKFTLFQRFGILAAAGDRHLVEFLPGFIQSPDTLFKWGIIRTPVSWRIERWKSAPQRTRELMSGQIPFRLGPSGEAVVGMIQALVGQGDIVTNVNMENDEQISNLPARVVVETNAHFSCNHIHPTKAGALPIGLMPLISLHCSNQELIIKAALTRDRDLAFQAFQNDPTNHLPIDISWEFFNKMLQVSHEYLPSMIFI